MNNQQINNCMYIYIYVCVYIYVYIILYICSILRCSWDRFDVHLDIDYKKYKSFPSENITVALCGEIGLRSMTWKSIYQSTWKSIFESMEHCGFKSNRE